MCYVSIAWLLRPCRSMMRRKVCLYTTLGKSPQPRMAIENNTYKAQLSKVMKQKTNRRTVREVQQDKQNCKAEVKTQHGTWMTQRSKEQRVEDKGEAGRQKNNSRQKNEVATTRQQGRQKNSKQQKNKAKKTKHDRLFHRGCTDSSGG